MLEVLLVLALLALFATVIVGGSERLLSAQPATVPDVFWKVVQEARKRALKAEHEIRLRFDEREQCFVLINGAAPTVLAADGVTRTEATLQTFSLPRGTGEIEVNFLGTGKGGPTIMVRGQVIESRDVKHVTFYADGTCTPFRLQIRRSGGVNTLAVDPWTCAPVLAPNDPNEFRP
jgi:general secretion pathway protein H